MNGNFVGGVTGLALRDGVLNAIVYDSVAGESELYRTLIPTKALDTTVWSSQGGDTSTTVGGLWLNRVPKSLQVTTDGKLWAINVPPASTGSSNAIFSLKDTLYKTAPAPTLPADKSVPATNPVTGRVEDIPFSWPKLSLATQYLIQISLDSALTQTIVNNTVTPNPVTLDPIVVVIGPYQTGAAYYNFAPDTTYFWRVQATEPLESPWSKTFSFSFSDVIRFGLVSPEVGAIDVPLDVIFNWTAYKGAIWYELTVSEDPSFAIPEWSHNVNNLFYAVTEDDGLKYGTTYYWRVRGVTAEPYVDKTKVITPAGPWALGAFTTMAEPTAPPTEQVVIVEKTTEIKTVEVPVTEVVQQAIPSWMLLTIIIIGAILVIALIILIIRTRRAA
jgi:hypothetical protein